MTAQVMTQTSDDRVAGIVVLSIIYAVSGYLGLLLRDPVTEGIVVWPAAGIAVAMLLGAGRRIWPGVPIGIFVLNLWIVRVAPAHGDIGLMMKMPGIAALAASVQALIAVTLITRRFGTPARLGGTRDLVLLLTFAGPVACIASAVIGSLGVYSYGLLPRSSFLLAGLKIWAGSSLGVVIFLPLALVTLAGRDGRRGVIWKGTRLRHVLTPLASFIVLAGLFVSASLANTINIDNAQNHREMFSLAASRDEAHLLHEFASLKGVLDEAAENVGDHPNRVFKTWQDIVHPSLVYRLQGLEAIGALSFPSERLFSQSSGQSLAVSESLQATGSPTVEFATPLDSTEPSRRFQIDSGGDIAAAARASVETGGPVAVQASVSTGTGAAVRRILLVDPVIAKDEDVGVAEKGPAQIRRWVFLVLNPHEIFPPAGRNDVGAFLHRLKLSGWAGTQELHPAVFVSGTVPDRAPQHIKTPLFQFGRSWLLTWASTPAFDATANHREGRLALVGGLLVTLLVAGLVQTLSSREDKVRREVDLRTAELAHELRKNKSIVENAAVGICLLAADGSILAANPACVPILGFPVPQLLEQNICSLLPEDSIISALDAAKAGAPVSEFRQIQIARPSRGEKWVEVRLSSFVGHSGEVIITLILKDVTENVLAREQLEKTERRWNLALDGSEIGVFDLDVPTGQAIASDAWRRLVGIPLSAGVDIESEWEARVHPEDLPRVKQADQECFAGKTDAVFVEYRLKRCDEVWRWMRGAARVVERDAAGQPLRYLGTMMDITELRDALALARSREEHLDSLIDTAPVAMAVVRLDGSFALINDAFCRFTGYSRDALARTPLQDLPGAKNFRRKRDEVRQMLRGERTSYVDEASFLRPDGKEVWGALKGTILRGRPGEPARFIAQILDITESKQLEIMKGDFVATVSHELRTPLTSINGSLGLILGAMSGGLPEKVSHLLNVAHQNGQRLLYLVNDILDMQNLSSGSFELHPVDLEIGDLVTQAVEEAQSFAAKFNVTLQVDKPSEMIQGRLDGMRVKQVLSNLLSNAAKFSHEGGMVRTSLEHRGDSITVSVTDHGRGIAKEFREKIFLPFSQASPASVRDREGTGLGLVICKDIVEHMGGTIGFESEPNVSTTFWFTIPL